SCFSSGSGHTLSKRDWSSDVCSSDLSTARQGGLEGRDQLTIIVLIAYGVTPFMESVTGFGLGVVITAPLLIHLGLTPARAVTTEIGRASWRGRGESRGGEVWGVRRSM